MSRSHRRKVFQRRRVTPLKGEPMTIPESEDENVEVTINMHPDAVYIELIPAEDGGVNYNVHGLKPKTHVMALSAGILHILSTKPELVNQAITDYMDAVQKDDKGDTGIQDKK